MMERRVMERMVRERRVRERRLRVRRVRERRVMERRVRERRERVRRVTERRVTERRVRERRVREMRAMERRLMKRRAMVSRSRLSPPWAVVEISHGEPKQIRFGLSSRFGFLSTSSAIGFHAGAKPSSSASSAVMHYLTAFYIEILSVSRLCLFQCSELKAFSPPG
jgi:chromatin segregation and condensation protein Rec8/ScpA/Scc1 (kleisin family)